MSEDEQRVELGDIYCSNTSLCYTLEMLKIIYRNTIDLLHKYYFLSIGNRDKLTIEYFITKSLIAMLKDFESTLIWTAALNDETDLVRMKIKDDLYEFAKNTPNDLKKLNDKIKEMDKETN